MSTTIPIKSFRANLANIADQVEQRKSFTVIRRSKPSFRVVQISDEVPEEEWETVIDFTKKGKEKGAKIQDALKVLKRINK